MIVRIFQEHLPIEKDVYLLHSFIKNMSLGFEYGVAKELISLVGPCSFTSQERMAGALSRTFSRAPGFQ